MKSWCVSAVLLAAVGVSIAQPSAPLRDVSSLVAAERAFAQAAKSAGTRTAFLAFLADDGIVFAPQPVNGRESWRARPAAGGWLDWRPIFAEVSGAGDLGYTTGPWAFRESTTAAAQPVAQGEYVSIWKRQADGAWKVALDTGINHSPPLAAMPEQFPKGPLHNDKQFAPASPGDARAALRQLEADFARQAATHGFAESFIDHAAEQVRLFRMDAFPVTGREAARALLTKQSGALAWQVVAADVSRSNDLGYTYGSYELKERGAEGGPTEQGHYLRIWQRRKDGAWRIALDLMRAQKPE